MAKKPVHIKHREQARKLAFQKFDEGKMSDELIADLCNTTPEQVTGFRNDWYFERLERRGKWS